MSGASGLRKHGHTTDGDGGTITGGSGGWDTVSTTGVALEAGRVDIFDSSHGASVTLDGSVAISSDGNVIDLVPAAGYDLVVDLAGNSRVVVSNGTGLVLPARSSDPSLGTLTEGQIYYNDISDVIRVYDGATWSDLTGGGGGGSVASDAIFDAKGDLAVGTGADTAAKLTVGANDTIIMADSGQSTGLKYVGSQTPSTQAFSDAAAEGTADTYARGDHKHAMPSFATPAIVLGSSASAGAAATPIRSDSTIAAFDATSPTTQALGDTAVVGSAAFAARRDHKHAMPTAAVTTSGLTQATARLLGRTTASTGAIEEITVGTGLSLSAGSLTATGGGGGSGSLILLEQHTASASATLDFTTAFSSTYDYYEIDILDLRPATDTVTLSMQAGTGGGPTWDTGNNYEWAAHRSQSGGSGQGGGTSTTCLLTAGDTMDNGVDSGFNGRYRFDNPTSSALNKRIQGQGTYRLDSTNTLLTSTFVGAYVSHTAVTGLRFLFSSGNITSGTIRIYGIAK